MNPTKTQTFTRAEAMALTLPDSMFPGAFWVASHRLALFAAVDWLGEGERCPDCTNGASYWGNDGTVGPCVRCKASGYLRQPADLLWALRRDVDPAVAIVVVWASVLRVLGGLSPVGRVFHRAFPPDGFVVIAGPDVPVLTYNRADDGPTRVSKGHILLDGTGDDLRITVEVPS